MKVLVSGFEPFDGLKINPSEQLVRSLQKSDMAFDLAGVVLPVSFRKSFSLLKQKIDQFKPDYVIGTGLASNKGEIAIERIAINLMEARIPDNEGFQPVNEKIIEGKEDGMFSDLPIKSMLKACQSVGIKSSISNTAGTYVCNYLMYQIISYGKEVGYQGGFIHIPPTPEVQLGVETMELSRISEGVTQMIKALKSNSENSLVNTGAEC